MSLMGVKGLKIRTCIERRFNYSKDITDRSETSVQKQNSDKYQLREILFVHNNAIAMKPALLKNKQTNKQTKNFPSMKTIKLLDKVKPFFLFSISKYFSRGKYKN